MQKKNTLILFIKSSNIIRENYFRMLEIEMVIIWGGYDFGGSLGMFQEALCSFS